MFLPLSSVKTSSSKISSTSKCLVWREEKTRVGYFSKVKTTREFCHEGFLVLLCWWPDGNFIDQRSSELKTDMIPGYYQSTSLALPPFAQTCYRPLGRLVFTRHSWFFAPSLTKEAFWWSLDPKIKNLMVESFFFFFARPFQSGLLIRLQCLLDGAVRRPSTGADAHLSSHVALSRLRPVWRRACALIYSIFGPLPPRFPHSLGSLCEKEKKNQLVPANKSKELQQNLD